MGPHWYCLAFGFELGPMSWDDLKTRAAKGDIGPATRVRCGPTGSWGEARLVPGLLNDAPSNDTDADFELSTGVATAPGDDAEFAASVPFAVPGQSNDLVDSEAPGKTVPTAPDEGAPAPPASTPQETSAAQANIESGALAEAAGSGEPSSTAAPKKRPATDKKGTAPPDLPKFSLPRLELHVPARAWQVLGLFLLLALVGGAVHWLWTRDRRDPNEYVRIADGMKQIFDELHRFREGPVEGARADIGAQLMPRVAALRKELLDAPPGSVGSTLSEAGSRLAELLSSSSITPGSPTAPKYLDTEKQFVLLIDQVRRDLEQ